MNTPNRAVRIKKPKVDSPTRRFPRVVPLPAPSMARVVSAGGALRDFGLDRARVFLPSVLQFHLVAGLRSFRAGRHLHRTVDLTVIESPLEQEDFLVIDIERFQGPLDLLLHLIRQQDIDVFEIPISRITRQFLAAIEGIEAEDLDNAGEFIEMAAGLIHIKAQMLLPSYGETEDEDPRAELVRRLLEYEQIRDISHRLATAEAERARRFGKGFLEPRPPSRLSLPAVLQCHLIAGLLSHGPG